MYLLDSRNQHGETGQSTEHLLEAVIRFILLIVLAIHEEVAERRIREIGLVDLFQRSNLLARSVAHKLHADE